MISSLTKYPDIFDSIRSPETQFKINDLFKIGYTNKIKRKKKLN